jgi:phage/plasmid primase-like uncharacterized protein
MNAFTQHLHDEGFTAAPEIAEPGKFYRFRSADKKSGKPCYAMLFDDMEGGIYGDFSTNDYRVWQSRRMREMPYEERQALEEAHRVKAAIALKMREDEYRRNAHKAAEVFSNLLPAPEDHPYLVKKQIKPFGARITPDGRLCILASCFDGDGLAPSTLQFIAADGEKRFMTGGKTGGAFVTIDGDNTTIYICEGYATGASINMATGCTVIVAFNAGNLMAVAKQARAKAPTASIIIAADDDFLTVRPPGHPKAGEPWNPGIESASEASAQIQASYIVPAFKNRGALKLTDFNDLHVTEGLSVVLAQLSVKSFALNLQDWTYNAQGFNGEPEKREWLIRGHFPLGQVSVVASAGGLGKSYMLLDLAHKVALAKHDDFWGMFSKTAFGKIEQFGTAVYMSAEDDRIEVHIRLSSIDPDRRLYNDGRGDKLIVIPCPSTDMSCRLFVSDRDEVKPTKTWLEIVQQLEQMPDLRMVAIDPIQALIAADMNNPSHVQAISSELSRLATKTGAAVIFAHHVKKPNNAHPIETPADAKESIRGTGAVVDSVRSACVIWEPDSTTGNDICDAIGVKYQPGIVARLAVVKSNGEAQREVKTLVRAETGILVDRTQDYKMALGETSDEARQDLMTAIASAHASGNGLKIIGREGIYSRREELSPTLMKQQRKQLEQAVHDLIVDCKVAKDADGYLYVT